MQAGRMIYERIHSMHIEYTTERKLYDICYYQGELDRWDTFHIERAIMPFVITTVAALCNRLLESNDASGA